MSGIYRKCVGIVVCKDHKVLLCERKDTPDAWQFPQGGIEDGESFIEAAYRELREETSITSVEVAAVISTPLRYTFSPEILRGRKWKHDGQDMQWVLFYFNGSDSEIDLQTSQPEFCNAAWESIDVAAQKIVEFKKQVYIQVINQFKPIVES